MATDASATPAPTPPVLPGAQMAALAENGTRVGMCPLERTVVRAKLAGNSGRTEVEQTFGNPFDQKIEAIYSFPLPSGAAIDGFKISISSRTIEGKIQTRDKARAIYEAAKRRGKVAALLDQQRPNLFSQSVANILPGQKIKVQISYTETVAWSDGGYEWNFPLVVGPAFAPASPDSSATTTKTEASAPASPSVPGELSSGAVSFDIHVEAGAPLEDVSSPTHAIEVTKPSGDDARVELKSGETVSNRDFSLRYHTASENISDAFLTDTDGKNGYFSLTLAPPRRVSPTQTRAKELLFVVDRSGSMDGFALEAAKKTMRAAFEALRPNDTFNVFSFSFGPEGCFDKSVPATPANRKIALRYLDSLEARGGTEMLPALREALDEPRDPARARIVVLATDGWVNNDLEIIDSVKRAANGARVFTFGVGSAVNRFLLDGIALEGRGEAEVVSSEGESDKAATRFVSRIDAPVLTDISIDWGNLPVADVFPRALPDLFASKPLVISGRLTGAARGTITLRGRTGNGLFERKIQVNAPTPIDNEALASRWARSKVADLMTRDLIGLQYDRFDPALKKQIERLGLDYHLLTQFTSFVAVDEASNTGKSAPKPVKVAPKAPAKVGPASAESAASDAKDEADAARTSPYAATSGSSFAGRAGDPLLRVEAPQNSRAVVAQMPDGEVKALAWNARSKSWEARFDIPTYALDGDYSVGVVIVPASGTRSHVQLHFRVDNSAPGAKAKLSGGKTWRLEVEAGGEVKRIVAILPWGARQELAPMSGGFALDVAPPANWSGARQVRLVVTDRAHNQTTIVVDESR